MNPEENNPLTNPGAPNFGVPANDPMVQPPATTDGISTMAPANPPMGIENPTTVEEPLVPAAPVPGSIGSVTSVPADTPDAFSAANQPAAATVPPENVAAPYNPFAQPAPADPAVPPTPAPIPTNPPAPAPAPMQPTNAPAAKKVAKHSPVTLLLAIVAVIAIVAAVIFAVLFVNAKNNPKVVYVPAVADDATSDVTDTFTCSTNVDYNYLVGYDHEVIGMQSFTFGYAGDTLETITEDIDVTFDSDVDAETARETFASMAPVRESMVAQFTTAGSEMTGRFEVDSNNSLSSADAIDIIYGGTGETDLSASAVRAHYVANGYTCGS